MSFLFHPRVLQLLQVKYRHVFDGLVIRELGLVLTRAIFRIRYGDMIILDAVKMGRFGVIMRMLHNIPAITIHPKKYA